MRLGETSKSLAPTTEAPDPAEQAWQLYISAIVNAWLRRVLGRVDLSEIEAVPLDWFVAEAPGLVDEMVRTAWSGSHGTGIERTPRLSRRATESVTGYAQRRLTTAPDAAGHDFLALQAQLTETLSRETDNTDPGHVATRLARLATLFEQLHEIVGAVGQPAPEPLSTLLTGSHGDHYLREWMGHLIAEYERYEKAFAVLLIGVDGLDYLVNAHGQAAATRMLDALQEIISGQLRATDRLFRIGSDQFCILAPNQEVDSIRHLAERLCTVIDSVQRDDQPRIGIAAGIASCPLHGTDPDTLLRAAEEAIWIARSNGNVATLQTA